MFLICTNGSWFGKRPIDVHVPRRMLNYFIFSDCASFRNTFHEALSFMMDGRYQLACLLHQATQT